MKFARFVCLFLFVATSLFGQSNPASEPKQPPTSPGFSRLPLRPPLAPAGRLAATQRTNHPQSSGLDFAVPLIFSSYGYRATSEAVADLNGDGNVDLLIANLCEDNLECPDPHGTVSVQLGNGDGTFQARGTYSSGGIDAIWVAAVDVNGDGKPDLLVVNACADDSCVSSSIGVLLGNGDGTFQPAVAYSSGGEDTFSIAVGDVNGDGKPDVLAASGCAIGNCAVGGFVSVLLGNGDGTFQAPVSYSTPGGGSAVAVADVNRDGKPDLLVVTSGVSVLLGNGDGTFQTAVLYGSGGEGPRSVAVADINGDGKPDLLVTNQCIVNCGNSDTQGGVGVLLGNGDGTFQSAVSYGSGPSAAVSVAVTDANGDGNLDLLVAGPFTDTAVPDVAAGVLLGNGDGTFQPIALYDAGGNNGGFVPEQVVTADLNGDGKPDVLVVIGCSDVNCYVGSVGVLINTSVASTATSIISSLNPSSFGQIVTFTATVTAQQGFSKTTPTGSVSFFDGATGLGNSPLNSAGVATLSISSLAVGTHSVTATYGGDSNFASSTSSALSQVVQGAIVQLSPTSLNFGNQTVSIASSSQNVTVSNTGNAALTISNIAVFVSNGGYLLGSTCAASLAPGASCTVSLSWTPITTGSMTGSVAFTDNAPNSPQTVSLTGVGVQPTVNLSPTSLTFPTQIVFTRSKTQTVMLSNTGLGILSLTKIAVTGSFTQTNNCGSTVNPGSNCTITVTFSPTKAGSIAGSLSITDNAPLSPQTVSLKGTGTDIQLTPASLKFGNQPVGTKSLPKKITLSNKGSFAVSITKISLTGADAGDFAQTNTCGKSVAAGASCSITVTFTPSAKGKRTGTVSSFDNGGGSPQIASLTGTGT